MKKNLIYLSTLALLSTSFLGFSASAEETRVADTETNVGIVADESAVHPKDPFQPSRDVEPVDGATGATGTLTIDYASNLEFGEGKISTKDQSYVAEAKELNTEDIINERPNYVQITDKRTGERGWNLTVQQMGQFATAESSPGANDQKELTNAELSFMNTEIKKPDSSKAHTPTLPSDEFTLDPEGAQHTVVKAEQGTGGGTWLTHFGYADHTDAIDTMHSSIRLDIPGGTVKEAAEYTTTLQWALNDTP